jgi:phage terminase small subunit
MAQLTAKQRAFVNEYLVDLNATQAAIRAGYSPKTANVQGAENLTKPNVTQAIEKAMELREKRTEITADRVLAELAKIAFADGSDFASLVTRETEDGPVTDVVFYDTDTLPKDKKAAISAIKKTKYGIAVETYDKIKALELIGRHLAMFTDKLNVSSDNITLKETLNDRLEVVSRALTAPPEAITQLLAAQQCIYSADKGPDIVHDYSETNENMQKSE